MKFTHVLVLYFICGSMMWAGGVVTWEEAGIVNVIMNPNTDGSLVNEETQQLIQDTSNVIEKVSSALQFAPLFAVTDLLFKLAGFVFWPITVLQIVGAPIEVVVLGGGTFTMAFLASFMGFVRGGQ